MSPSDGRRRPAARRSALHRAALVAEIVVTYAVVRWQVRRRDLPAAVAAPADRGARPTPSRSLATPTSAAWRQPPSGFCEAARRLALPDAVARRPRDARAARHRRRAGPRGPARRRRSRPTPGSSAAGRSAAADARVRRRAADRALTPSVARCAAHEELMLLAGGHARAARTASAGRVRELLDRVDVGRAARPSLAYQRLVPLLGGRILEHGRARRRPRTFAGAVARADPGVARGRGAAGAHDAADRGCARGRRGRQRPAEGPAPGARAARRSRRCGSRAISTCSSRRADLGRAPPTLAPLGWRPDPTPRRPVLHSLAHGAGLPDVELHWRVHWYETSSARARWRARSPGPDGVRRLQAATTRRACSTTPATASPACATRPTLAAWWDARDRSASSRAAARMAIARTRASARPVGERDRARPARRRPRRRLVPAVAAPAGGAAGRAARQSPRCAAPPAQITAEVSLVDGLLAPAGQRGARPCAGGCSWARGELPPAGPRGRSRRSRRARRTAAGAVGGARPAPSRAALTRSGGPGYCSAAQPSSSNAPSIAATWPHGSLRRG